MENVIDYFNYLKTHKTAARTADLVDLIYPKIEDVIDTEVSKMFSSQELFELFKEETRKKSLFDETIVISLCWLLSHYLIALATRPNSLNVTVENVDDFIQSVLGETLAVMKENHATE